MKVFETIVDIMHHDYAGCIDKKDWDNPDIYIKRIKNHESNQTLTRDVFEEIVYEYLLEFKDEHNRLTSISKELPPQTIGFRVRHYHNRLYVEKVTHEACGLQYGDCITEINRQSIDTVADQNRLILKSHMSEREDWERVLLKASDVTTLEGNHIKLQHFDYIREKPFYTYTNVEGIPILKFNDFTDLKQMEELLKSRKQELMSSHLWIIDVRECRGGADNVYLPLLNYIMPKHFVGEQDEAKHLITGRNYENRMAIFKKFNQNADDPFINAFIKQMKKNVGKGFVNFDLGDYEDENRLIGSNHPRQVVILTDRFCGSSGEQFVIDSAQSPKVTLVGRATRGVLDYSNQAVEVFEKEGYEFVYATSRSDRIDKGTGIDFVGIQPDIHVPWTPKHIESDIDIKVAIQVLKTNNS